MKPNITGTEQFDSLTWISCPRCGYANELDHETCFACSTELSTQPMQINPKMVAAVALTQALYPGTDSVPYPADWERLENPNPDLCLGTGNDFWLKSWTEDKSLYLQDRYPLGGNKFSIDRAVRVLRAAKVLNEAFGIRVKIPWDSKEVFQKYYNLPLEDRQPEYHPQEPIA